MSYAQRIGSVSNIPLPIAGGARVSLETIFASNPGASGAYVKLYASADTPDATSVPIWSVLVPAGQCPPLPVFVDQSDLWIAATTEDGAGLTAPATAFVVSITRG